MNKIVVSVAQAEEIIQHKMHDVQEKLSHIDQFNHYIIETLNSFAYRYFEEAAPAEFISEKEMRVIAIEKGIKEAIKIKNAELRLGIGELVKRVSKDQGPTIARELRVQILKRDPGHGGHCHVLSRVSYGHPDHDFKKGSYIEKMSSLQFVDEVDFRNNLAKHLELVCELFECS
jgi:hypothetical protein